MKVSELRDRVTLNLVDVSGSVSPLRVRDRNLERQCGESDDQMLRPIAVDQYDVRLPAVEHAPNLAETAREVLDAGELRIAAARPGVHDLELRLREGGTHLVACRPEFGRCV